MKRLITLKNAGLNDINELRNMGFKDAHQNHEGAVVCVNIESKLFAIFPKWTFPLMQWETGELFICNDRDEFFNILCSEKDFDLILDENTNILNNLKNNYIDWEYICSNGVCIKFCKTENNIIAYEISNEFGILLSGESERDEDEIIRIIELNPLHLINSVNVGEQESISMVEKISEMISI